MKISEAERDTILQRLGMPAASFLGSGGEAAVYALDSKRIARIPHTKSDPDRVRGRVALLEELAAGTARVPFGIPEVLDLVEIDGRVVTIERRLAGRSLEKVLGEVEGSRREDLIRAYLDAAAQVGDIPIERPWFGELLDHSPERAPTYRAYLEQRARVSLSRAGDAY